MSKNKDKVKNLKNNINQFSMENYIPFNFLYPIQELNNNQNMAEFAHNLNPFSHISNVYEIIEIFITSIYVKILKKVYSSTTNNDL